MTTVLHFFIRCITAWAFLAPFLQLSGQTVFDLGVTTTAAGTEIVLPLRISSGSEPVGFQCEIQYEGAGVEMKPATAGSALSPSHTVSTKLLTFKRQRIVVDSLQGSSIGDGVALQIPFSIAADATAANFTIRIIDLIVANAAGDPVLPDDVTAGEVKVSRGLAGSPLQISTVQFDRAADEFAFSFSDEEGTSFRIESSSDLNDWQSVGNFTVEADGILEFAAPAPAATGTRWFRAIKLL